MSVKLVSLNKLKSDNFKIEHELKTENRKILTKMFRYIDTFPLKEYEMELIRKDLIGMALEAECRKECFRDTLGKKPKEFCDDIICASTDYEVPDGRKYLRMASVYCYTVGCCYLMVCGWALMLALCLLPFSLDAFHAEGSLFIETLILSIPGILYGLLYLKAGTIANMHSGNPLKAEICLRWGILILLAFIGMTAFTYVYEPFAASPDIELSVNNTFAEIINCLLLVVQFLFSLLYILGAYKNKKEGASHK